jgi:putative transposase
MLHLQQISSKNSPLSLPPLWRTGGTGSFNRRPRTRLAGLRKDPSASPSVFWHRCFKHHIPFGKCHVNKTILRSQRRTKLERSAKPDRRQGRMIVTPGDRNGCAGPLARCTAATPGPSTRFRRTGHLFQGRFGAVVMDEPHLLAAARYIALNPVVAGLVSRAEDWPWSSTRAPLAGEDGELATVAPLRALIPDFAAPLATPADAATTTRIERGPTIGRPLGRPEWIAMLERRLGRPLAPRNP